jgi:2-aminoadipate transaminase
MPEYDFGSGRPDPGSFPTAELADAAVRAIHQVGGDLVLYPGDLGHRGLREAMAARESGREGVAVSPDQIALTNGSMQGVTLVAEALTDKPGDIVVLEELNYPGTLAAYRRLGLRLVGVPVDNQGMRVDLLDEILSDLNRKGTPARFIYTLASYHNPTGAVMPRERRLQLIEVARRHQTIVVEDNCYGDVHFEGKVEPALYALDDSPDLIYLGSLSKILGAGIRLGYLLARPPMLGRLLERRFDGGNSVLAASICAEFLRDRLREHVARTNAILKEKRDAVVAGLQASAGDLCTWSHPPGGLFIWVGFPEKVDRDRLSVLAGERGIAYTRGSAFHVRGEEIPFLRLAFGYPSLEAIRAGIPVLGECIRRARAG